MRTWDTFYPYVLPEVLGCPEPTVDLHLVGAAREFCVATRCWREVLETIRTTSAEVDYDIYYPKGAQGITLVGAAINGRDVGFDAPDASTLAERLRGNSGPKRVRTQDMRRVQILPTPAAGLDVVLEALLQPTESCTGLPDAVADAYLRAIAGGALASLLAMSGQPWTNVAAAGIKRGLFERDMARVKSRIWKGNSNLRPRVSGQFF
jgi:hypothetical protein